MQRIIYKYNKINLNPSLFSIKTIVFVLLFLLFLTPFFTCYASAEGEEYTTAYWLKQLQDILPDALSEQVSLEKEEDVLALTGLPYIFSLVFGGFSDKLPSLLGLLASLFGMALLSGMGHLLTDGFAGKATKRTTEVVVLSTLSLALYQLTSPALLRGLSAIGDVTEFTALLVPIMGGVYVAGGNYTAAATQSGAMTWLVAEINALSNGVLRSILCTSFAFTLLGALGAGIDTAGLGKTLRRIFLTAIGVMATLFSGSLAIQTTLSASTDSVAMRTAKYAVGQMIPAVGSTVSGTLSTVAVSLELVKNTVGAGGLGVLLTLLIPPLLELYLLSVVLSLAGSFAGLVGFGAGEKLFSDFKSIFDMSIGVLAISGVMLMLSLGIFMKTALAVG